MPPKKKKGQNVRPLFNQPPAPVIAAASLGAVQEQTAADDMAMRDDPEAAQKNEFASMQAIYASDFKEIEGKKDAWRDSPNRACELRVRSAREEGLSVLLMFDLPHLYPKVLPVIEIKEVEATNPNVKVRVQKVLDTVTPKFLGSVMIFEIHDAVQEVLEDAAISRANRDQLPSLAEELAQREAAVKQEAAKRQQELLHEQERAEAEEDRTITQQVQARQLQAQTADRSGVLSPKLRSVVPVKIANACKSFDQPMTARAVKTGSNFYFSQVEGRIVVLKTNEKQVTIVNPVAEERIRVPRLLLKDIHIPEMPEDSESLKQTMQDIEELLESSKLHRHSNVVDLLGYSIVRNLSTTKNKDGAIAVWELSILSEFANKGSMSELLDVCGQLSAWKIRTWTHQLLDALEFFDKHGYVHPAVSLGNILLFLSPNGAVTVKLSDGYGTALHELVMMTRSLTGSVPSELPLWTAPELSTTQMRTAKTCIWDLGVVMLQMIYGKSVTNDYTSPKNFIESNNLTDALEDMLIDMFQPDPRRRLKAFDLTSAGFIHGSAAIYNRETPSAQATPANRKRYASSRESEYEKNWEEVEVLGKGGFGQVVKARNRMDGSFYAVKKVKCQSKKELDLMLSEIKVLSRSRSLRVVRYFHCWVEREDGGHVQTQRIDPQLTREVSDLFPMDHTDKTPNTGLDFLHARGLDISDPYQPMGMQFSYGRSDISSDNVQFGYDDEEMSSPEGKDERQSTRAFDNNLSSPEYSAQPPESLLRSSYAEENRLEKATLYIQMEFCENKTLRSILGQKLSEQPVEIWRLFRQITEGLAHIHELGVIHRDLKPENVFLDTANNVRVGDFGLSTTGHFDIVTSKAAPLIASEETRSIGTALYVAPELRTNASGRYTAKVDMYSLGIMLYEMCVPFTTNMERQTQLFRMREQHHVLPEKFKDPAWSEQGHIIMELLNHYYQSRPTAKELLASGKIPEPLEDQRMRQTIMNMAASKTGEFQQILSNLFALPVQRLQSFGWDDKKVAKVGATETVLSTFVNDKLARLFRRHGAVDTSRQGIFPKSNHYSNAATFLDGSGVVVQLPYDLTLPFARSLAYRKPEYAKSYSFGLVYRAGVSGMEPFRTSEVNFDIVSDNARNLALKEAEVLKVLDEVVDEFPSLRSKNIALLINHADLLNIVLDFCRIQEQHRAEVKRILSNLNIGLFRWQHVQNELRSSTLNIPITSVNELKRFDFSESDDTAQEKLTKMFENTQYSNQVAQIFSRLREVTDYLSRFNIKMKVVLSPLSNNSEQLYRGSIMFQCRDNEQKKILAVGGRYDELIQEFQTHNMKGTTRAVGVRLNVMDLVERVKIDLSNTNTSKQSRGSAWPRRCDVLVTSLDVATLNGACLEVVQDLWANDISAEVTEQFSSMEALTNAYAGEGQCLVVYIRREHHTMGSRTLKVRTLGKQDDTEVREAELVPWLKLTMKDWSSSESGGEYARTKLRREASQAEQSSFLPPPKQPEVIVVTPQHKNKKLNRQAIHDAAISQSRLLAEMYVLQAPILAIDTSDEILNGIRNTLLVTPELWRNVISSAPLQELQYLKAVQQELKNLAAAGAEGAFIYNYRTTACTYYDFGKTA